MRYLYPLIALLIVALDGAAQSSPELNQENRIDSTTSRKLHWVAPAVLIGIGAVTAMDKDADEFFLSNFEVREERNERFINFSNHLDDYLQHVPSATTFLMSAFGVQGKSDIFNQVALYLKSELLMLAIVYPLKYTIGEARPDTGNRNSFPSGHTAQAFAAATFFSKEYGDRSVWYSIGGYTAASAVGVMRMLNNRHWISDVLVGAGIGILSTNIVYATHQYKWGKKNVNQIGLTPGSAYGSKGFTLTYTLR